jgi:hypothetical protein
MGIPLREGRDLASADLAMNPTTAVLVNETFVRRFFAHERAVGRDFGRTEDRNRLQPQHIVGVVGDAKYRDLREPPPPTVYVPLEGFGAFGGLTLQIRSPFPVAGLLPQLRTELSRVHPALEIGDVSDQKVLVDNAMLRERLLALLAGFFALVTLVLAVIGCVRRDELLGRSAHARDWYPGRARGTSDQRPSVCIDRRIGRHGARASDRPRRRHAARAFRPDALIRSDAVRRDKRRTADRGASCGRAGGRCPPGSSRRPRGSDRSSQVRVGAHANAARRGQGRLRRGRSPASTTRFEAPYGNNNRRFCREDNSL